MTVILSSLVISGHNGFGFGYKFDRTSLSLE